MRYILLLMVLICTSGFSQWKSYIIGVKGDTLNRVDAKNLQQGKWVVHMESLRGEPGYEEEGEFKDGKKTGTWRRYSLEGDIMAIENYRFGVKNGTCQYYSMQGLVREESWRAIDPLHPYDTVKVYDLKEPGNYTSRLMKVESSTVKQGTWNYYDPATGNIVKTEEYEYDQLIPQNRAKISGQQMTDSTVVAKADSSKMKPAEVLQYEKKNANKKKVKVREGSTGVQ